MTTVENPEQAENRSEADAEVTPARANLGMIFFVIFAGLIAAALIVDLLRGWMRSL